MIPRKLAAAVLLIPALSSCGQAESQSAAALLEELNEDEVFALAPPGGSIERSLFPEGCGVDRESTEVGPEVNISFDGSRSDAEEFFRDELPAHGWEVTGVRTQGTATAIDASKVASNEDEYHLVVTIGDNAATIHGYTPPSFECP